MLGNWTIPYFRVNQNPTVQKDRVLTLDQFTLAFAKFSSLLVSFLLSLGPRFVYPLAPTDQVLQVARDGGDWASFDLQIRTHIQHGLRKWGINVQISQCKLSNPVSKI